MIKAADAADKIMALVDETPSEPFSFERRQVLDLITCIIAQHTQELDDDADSAFQLGVEEGISQAREEYDPQIQDLNDEISTLKEEKDSEYQKGYDDGFDAAIATGN